MKRYNLILLLLFFISCLSCKKKREALDVERSLKSFYGQSIVFTKNLSETSTEISGGHQFTLVIFIDSVGCTLCELEHVTLWKQYRTVLEKLNMDILLVMHRAEKEQTEQMLSNLGIEFPILFDKENSFKKINSIPDDKRFYTFVVNQKKEVIWIGSPIANKESWNRFQEMMKEPMIH